MDISLHHRRIDGGLGACFAAIEVKKHPVPYDEDIDKLNALLCHSQSIRYGYLLTYFQKQEYVSGKNKPLADRIQDCANGITASVRVCGHLRCEHLPAKRIGRLALDEGDWHAAALVTRLGRH